MMVNFMCQLSRLRCPVVWSDTSLNIAGKIIYIYSHPIDSVSLENPKTRLTHPPKWLPSFPIHSPQDRQNVLC